jgi:hypothetical protein
MPVDADCVAALLHRGFGGNLMQQSGCGGGSKTPVARAPRVPAATTTARAPSSAIADPRSVRASTASRQTRSATRSGTHPPSSGRRSRQPLRSRTGWQPTLTRRWRSSRSCSRPPVSRLAHATPSPWSGRDDLAGDVAAAASAAAQPRRGTHQPRNRSHTARSRPASLRRRS